MKETQQSIGQWAINTFPGDPGLLPRHSIRLLEEVMELCFAVGTTPREIYQAFLQHGFPEGQDVDERRPEPAKVPAELADCNVVLNVLAHRASIDLGDQTDAKMGINRARRWAVRGDGTGYHIKEGEAR